ncbi:glycosyltransferase family 1 protein, partial [Streptomyces sp. SID14478]|nr:glycosyltransferase family 1 protein [Streptomyces sp. SID14478]
GAAGRARVLERFTWARAAQGTAERYREAIDKASTAPGAPSVRPHQNIPQETPQESRATC